MSDKENKMKIDVSNENGWVAFALLVIFFYGDPDIADAIIHFLMK